MAATLWCEMPDDWRFERLTLPNGLRMRVARAGAGPLMVMLHDFPECWYSFRHQLREFSTSFDCIAPEMRGYGETDAPAGVSNYTLEKLVEDIDGLIAAVGREKAIVIGHDWGGAVAWSLALLKPRRVERLVVMNCPHPAIFRRHLASNLRQLWRSWYMFFFQIPMIPEALLRRRDFEVIGRLMRATAVNKAAFSDQDIQHFRSAFASKSYNCTAALNYYRAMMRRFILGGRPDWQWMTNRIKAPTLLIWGERDTALGKELTYNMEPLFAGPFTLHYVPDSGHWVQQERPDIVNKQIRQFLSE